MDMGLNLDKYPFGMMGGQQGRMMQGMGAMGGMGGGMRSGSPHEATGSSSPLPDRDPAVANSEAGLAASSLRNSFENRIVFLTSRSAFLAATYFGSSFRACSKHVAASS